MEHGVKRVRQAATRALLVAVLGGGWAMLAAVPVGAALLTWLGGLG